MDSAIMLSVLAFLIVQTFGAQKEHELYQHLLTDYLSWERPVKNVSDPLTVSLAVILQQIIFVDARQQQITLNAWLQYTWHDYRLAWEPEEHGGVADLRFPSAALWKPDVLLYNSVDSAFDSTYQSNVLVYADGTCNWLPPGIFTMSCQLNIKWFPFDEQRCFFKFGSWSYDGTKLDLRTADVPFDMSEYILNSEWNLYKVHARRNVKYYPEPYIDLMFVMYMRRKTLYYAFNLIIPCVLLAFMCALGYQLPVDCGEKISLQVTIMLTICFFLNILTTMLPATSTAVPLLGIFFSMCMVVSAVSTLATVAVLSLHHRKPETHHNMGPLVSMMSAVLHTAKKLREKTRRVLLEWLPWLMFMRRPGVRISRNDLFKDPLGRLADEDEEKRPADADFELRLSRCCKSLATSLEGGRVAGVDLFKTGTLVLTQRMLMQIRSITRHHKQTDRLDAVDKEWNFAAMVVDRLCMYLFAFLISFFSMYVLFSAPYVTGEEVEGIGE